MSDIRKINTEGAISIRIRPGERARIDQAALLAGKTGSEFMLEAARRAADEALMDQVLFRVDRATFDAFLHRLDAPPAPNERLRKTMTTPPPWG